MLEQLQILNLINILDGEIKRTNSRIGARQSRLY